jgi:4a-hydroxytetrahydrobiopterin dehydratase
MGGPLPTGAVAEAGLSDWRLMDSKIRARFTAQSYTKAADLLSTIARAADDADHHPDLDLRYPAEVLVTLTTHSAGGVTQLDLDLAAVISALAADAGAQANVVYPTTP